MNTVKTALRYAFSRKNAQRTSSVMIILGLALCVAAIIITGSVVEALQSRQLDVLRSVESFDLIVNSKKLKAQDLNSIKEVSQAFDFGETTAIVNGRALRIRGLDLDSFTVNDRAAEFFSFTSIDKKGLLLSVYTYKLNGLTRKDILDVTFLKKGKTATVVPVSRKMSIGGIFSCSEQTFSQTTALIDLDSYKDTIGDINIKTGVFINCDTKRAVNSIKALDNEAEITTWQEYNKATYSALMLEKVVIYIFMSFMFVILCTSLRNSTQRLISNRKNEAAILRALGCTKRYVTLIFMVQGLIIALIGELLGVVLGIVVINNMQNIFGLAGFVSTLALEINYSLKEIFVLCIAVTTLAALYTNAACKKLRKNEIMEVLLHENY